MHAWRSAPPTWRACRALLYRLLNIDPNSCDGLSDYFNGVPCQLELPQSRGSPRAGGSAAVIGTGKKRKASPGSPPASASRQATIQTLNLGLFTGFANIAPGSWNDLSRRPHDAAGLQKLLHSNLRSRPALPCSMMACMNPSLSISLSLVRANKGQHDSSATPLTGETASDVHRGAEKRGLSRVATHSGAT